MNLISFTPTFVFVAINLLVLYIIMKKILFKPVTQFMENRTKSIKDSIENAEKNKADAAKLKEQYEFQLRTAKTEAERIITEAKARASKEYDAIINASKVDAQNIKTKAMEEIDRERDQMLKSIKNQVASLALAAASKVIDANMDTVSNKVIVDKFIDESGVA